MAPDEGDKNRVVHIYNVENLYAAVVEAYIEWQTALVEAVIRASVSGATAMHFRGHEHCIRRLANLLQVASAYRQGRKWRCECNYSQILSGKLAGRGLESPTRDLYDVAVAAELDPCALEAAVNTVADATWQETTTGWQETATMHAALASDALRGVPEG